MTRFPLHDETTAPEAARPMFARVTGSMGFMPNVFRRLAEEPAALEAYLDIDRLLDGSALQAGEKQVVLLTASRVNGCDYCVAAHTGGSMKAGLDDATIKALRAGADLPDARLDALRRFTEEMVRERGFVSDTAMQDFLGAGYTPQHVLAVILAVAMKTISNYANHITKPPLDSQLESFAWSPKT